MKKQNDLDHFFQNISKVIFIIPVIVVLVAIWFKTPSSRSLSYTNRVTPTQSIAASQPITVTPPPAGSGYKLDLKGPHKCSAAEGAKSVSLYIKNKKIFTEMTDNGIKQRALLAGDCIYNWSGSTGTKTCGISQYMDLLEFASNFGGLDINTIIDRVGDSVTDSEKALTRKVVESCTKADFSESIFAIPANVAFTEKKIEGGIENLMTNPDL